MEDDSSVPKVLTNDGLLGEILPRLHCPTCYARAALASKRWLRNASSQATIRSFRSQQSPHLLGVYVLCDFFSCPEFVPLPDASMPELEPALRHGKFGFEDLDTSALSVWDCRSGRVLYRFGPSFELPLGPAVQTPLRHPGENRAVLPRLPYTICSPHAMLLPDDDDDSSCYRVDIEQRDRMVYAEVYVLRAGSWSIHCSASADLAGSPVLHILKATLLMRGTVYMFTTAGYILALDLATAKFSTIDLPEGVQFEYSTNLAPCRGDDSVLYLFHVSGDELTVWLRRMNDHGGGDGSSAGEWILRNTVSLVQTCGHLAEQGWELEDRREAFVSVVGVGDNAEFVFLELEQTGVIVYMHLKSRKVKKVYQRHPYNDFGIRVLPFMMSWPAVLPGL